MVSNIVYKFSAFADYGNISFSQQNMNLLMETFADRELIPAMVNEVTGDGRSMSRLQLATADRLLCISVMSGRIDIQIASDKKGGFDGGQQAQLKAVMADCMGKIYRVFDEIIQESYRLAWDVTYVYFEIDEQERLAYRNRFLQEVPFYKEGYTDEFVAQYVGRREEEIHGRKEWMNVLTTIDRWFPGTGVGNVATVDGYKIEFDINTDHNSRKNRFAGESFGQFIEAAAEIQKELEESFFHGCK